MSRLLYAATASLDGFIAGPGGDMSWLADHLDDDNPAMAGLVDLIGSLLIGRRTYDGDDPNAGTDAEGAFGGTYEGPAVVLTHRPPGAPVPGVTFATDLDAAVAAARAAAGERYVNVLGADVARQCLAAGVLDEILMIVVPVLLGDGVRLFEHAGGQRIRLERTDTSAGQQAVNLWYRVVYP